MNRFACSLDDDNRGLRRDRWLRLGSRALIEFDKTDRGLRLVFATEPGVERELLELTELERDCCAFASWTVTSPNSRVVLEIVGKDDDAVPAVQGMFNPVGPRKLVRGPEWLRVMETDGSRVRKCGSGNRPSLLTG